MTKDERLTLNAVLPLVNRPSSILVIGLGNPILGDDGVGWKVAEAVRELLLSSLRPSPIGRGGDGIEVDCLSLGGLSLMERMLGYERVILIDSAATGQSPQGSVRVFSLASLPHPSVGHSASAHDTTLMTALQTAQRLGAAVPSRVDVVAIETKRVYDFSEQLSPPVAAAVPLAAGTVLDLLKVPEGGQHDLP